MPRLLAAVLATKTDYAIIQVSTTLKGSGTLVIVLGQEVGLATCCQPYRLIENRRFPAGQS